MKEHLHGRLRRGGFTLAEPLVVIAIIAVAGGLLLPALAQAKTKAQGINERVRSHSLNTLFGRFDPANSADPTVGGKNALPAHHPPSSPSTCS